MPKPRNEPTWNETFVYDHVSRFSDSVVMLELHDKNGFGADEAMAQVVLPVKSLPQVREVLKERRSPRERGRMGTSV
jgi:Ca2+-dependent lipid-binding protein